MSVGSSSSTCEIYELDSIFYNKTKSVKLYSRLATTDDIDQLVDIVNWAYRGKEGTNPWTTEKGLVEGKRITPQMLENLLSTDKNVTQIFVLENAGADSTLQDGAAARKEVLGCVKIDRESAVDTNAVIGMLSVNPHFQSQGIGGILLKLAENYLKSQWKIKYSYLHVIETRHELLKWYRASGYVETGEKEPFDFPNSKALIENMYFIYLNKQL
ncbi:hypothetical protein DLAC_07504 [Tieghemostelium lacteum]|uniref:N-acetyltransferase domain-containing protein n=1 Tax=Tieghemostelium lacteum TaxID=361077 RepID=A0A151ZCP4_TIELA|nr:hypothetical protein DLAC_07504 [Tieghemostelium lacteum]|eukprot:KYQ91722.1 hypothetical protein DLAC_07504 [Tieghemostelium lacteum]